MSPQIIKTKITLPVADGQKISRPSLLSRLNDALNKKLTIVSAPAGFGKTTILTQWAHSNNIDTAWVSLDRRDDDPTVFWTYLISSLQKQNPNLGQRSLEMLDSIVSPPITSILIPLLNELSEEKQNFFLIIDDYHLIQSPIIHESLSFFIDHMPPQMRLAVAARDIPPIPLSRLRVQNQLNELGMDVLRFSRDDIKMFIQDVVGIDLAPDVIDMIEKRLDGWAAGLQLAALSIKGKADPEREVVSFFTRSHHFIGTYLLEEIFLQQTDTIRKFLLETSILDRLSSPLCDAVIEQEGSQNLLEKLYAGNLFIIPLDSGKTWYRYHHLFGDFLRKRLSENHPERVPKLHRNAGAWFADNNFENEAIYHFFESGDTREAISLIETYAMDAIHKGQSPVVYNWLKKLPEDVVRSNPMFSIFQTSMLLFEKGALYPETIAQRLDDAQKRISEYQNNCNENPQQQLDYDLAEATILTFKASLSRVRGDAPEKIIRLGEKTLLRLDENFIELRSITLINIFLAHLFNEDLKAAADVLAKLPPLLQKKDIYYLNVLHRYFRAWLATTRGELEAAAVTCREGITYTSSKYASAPVSGIIQLCLGDILFEWNEMKRAKSLLIEGIPLAEQAREWASIVLLGYATLVRLKTAGQDNTNDIVSLIDKIAGMADYRRGAELLAASLKINLLLKNSQKDKKQIDAAHKLVQQHGLPLEAHTEFSPNHFLERRWRREMQYSQIRVYIEQSLSQKLPGVKRHLNTAATFLRHQLDIAEKNGNVSTRIETLILQALVFHTLGDQDQAIEFLEKALRLAEPGKYIRIFIDKGKPMAKLLTLAVRKGIFIQYSSRLLALLHNNLPGRAKTDFTGSQIMEPLSKREQEVLRLIASGMSNKDIAENLFLAPNTIKRHISNIYGKLDVNNRVKAVSKAERLNLL